MLIIEIQLLCKNYNINTFIETYKFLYNFNEIFNINNVNNESNENIKISKNIKNNEIIQNNKNNYKNERQKHGFIFEEQICDIILQTENIKEKSNYTSIYDLITMKNNYSIKTTCKNNICFGCPQRIYNYNMVNIILIIYEKINNYSQPIQIIELSLNNNSIIKNIFFNNICFEEILELNNYIKQIPHGIVSDSIKCNYKNKSKLLSNKSGLIKFNPKVDSKKQRRLQCSISNIHKAISKHPEIVIYNSKTNLYRDNIINYVI
jgi:hypothetical protein